MKSSKDKISDAIVVIKEDKILPNYLLYWVKQDENNNVYIFDSKFLQVFGDDIKKSINTGSINDTIIIQPEISVNDFSDSTDFGWLKSALAILRKTPDIKIILSSLFDKNTLAGLSKGHYLAEILSYPNCRLYKMSPFAESFDDINSIFDLENEHLYSQEIAKEKNDYFISELKHDIKYWWFDSQREYLLEEVESIISKISINSKEYIVLDKVIKNCKLYYPSMITKTNTQIIKRILDSKMNIPEIAKWKFFPWVYVDVDGTLFERVAKWSDSEWSQKPNQELLLELQELAKSWKEIHIFTWWNLEEKQKLLDKFDIKYKLVSK